MINKLITLWFGLLISHVAFANAVNVDSGDKKALLRSVMPTACHFSGDFIQNKKIQGLSAPLISDGEFFFSCDIGIIWQTQSPFAEALIYSHYFNYRVSGDAIEKLTSLTHYGMSKIMLKMLNGDVDYFAESFSVGSLIDGELSLSPQSKFMKKAIDKIVLQKTQVDDSISLLVNIHDKSQQLTKITIDNLVEYDLENKQVARRQCEKNHADKEVLCEILHYPARFDE